MAPNDQCRRPEGRRDSAAVSSCYRAFQKSACSCRRLVLEQRPDHFGRTLAGGEHLFARQIEGRVLLVRAGLRFQRLLGLAETTRPIPAQ